VKLADVPENNEMTASAFFREKLRYYSYTND
jgi:hypothetical protein